jgi:hypothetical protein
VCLSFPPMLRHSVFVCYQITMNDQTEIANDHRVRMLDILEDEEAVIRVRTKFHVSLVFSRFTIEVFEKDGVVYTRQEANNITPEDIQSVGEEEYGSELETQPFDWEDQFTTPNDPPVVIDLAGGDFHQVNEKHASRIEGLGDDIGGKVLEFDSVGDIDAKGEVPDYLKPGDTQIECSQTESEADQNGTTSMRYQEMDLYGYVYYGKVIAIADTQSPTDE